jgi:UPF0755 protein
MAGRLETEGLVENRHLFALYMRVTGGAAHLVEGSHFLSDDLSPLELRRRLERSSWGARARVTLPEGWTRFDMARRFEAQGICTLRAFLDATKDPRLLAELRIESVSAEGYLFPATYDFLKDSDATDVVRRMKAEFDRRYDAVADKNLPAVGALSDELGWSTKQFVILASMVEKEARVDEERSTVAGVFVNRLKDPNFRPKLLQCDPTAAYGCLDNPTQAPSCANYTGKVTHDIVADPENIYNTYKHEGLPPGPISNPGAKSLEAALFPANTRYLYFVARGDGHHTFSETYSAHTQAIKGAKGQGEPRGRPSP